MEQERSLWKERVAELSAVLRSNGIWLCVTALYVAIGGAAALRLMPDVEPAERSAAAPVAASVVPPLVPEPLPARVAEQAAAAPRNVGSERAKATDRTAGRLAVAMTGIWTRDAHRLVEVVAGATSADAPLPLTFLLAIAHAETNGKILTVSAAGAVGLAQATPIAYLQEGFAGRLFVTDEYVRGAACYFLKKPLDDADTIATFLLASRKPSDFERAQQMLESAFEYRLEGIDELHLLAPFAPSSFVEEVEQANRHNREVLEQLERLIATRAGKHALRTFRDEVRKEYRLLRDEQRASWSEYQRQMTAARDRLLFEHFASVERALRDYPYEAGEILAQELDARFSPTKMAAFLDAHIRTKWDEARALGVGHERIEALTAALYNGGGHNVKRMRSGLAPHIVETERYMEKVPRTRRILDAALGHGTVATGVIASSAPRKRGGESG